MHGKRLYTLAQTTLALIAAAGFLLGQSDTADNTTPDRYDYSANTILNQYNNAANIILTRSDTADNTTPDRYDYSANIILNQYSNAANIILAQSDTAVDTTAKEYDYYLDTPPEEYYIPRGQSAETPQTPEKPARSGADGDIPPDYPDGENTDIPPEQSDIASDTASAPAADTLSVRVPRSEEELGAMSREELYRLAFRRAAPERPRSLIMRLFVDGRPFGNTEIVHDSAFASFNFQSRLFSRYLDTLLLPEARAAAGDSVGYFNSAVLEAAGYAVSADEQMYELHVTVPPEDKILQRLSLGGGYARQPQGVEVRPSAVSFYVNYRGDGNLRYNDYHRYRRDDYRDVYRDTVQRDPLNLDLEGALNVYGWVLEGSARAREPYEGPWAAWDNFSRGDARLVRDIVPWRVRVTAGDVSMGSDLLPGEAVGGVRYEYNDWFFGGEPSSARAKVSFFMPRAGEVELYMDGRFRQRFSLPAGNHEISGFGGNIGRNKVRLVLRMEGGGEEEIPYEFVLGDPRNMLLGESRYTVTAGVRRVSAPAPMSYDYDVKEPAAGADILYGLLPSVSTGAAAQASNENGVAAVQVLWNLGSPGWVNARAYGSQSLNSKRNGGRADVSYTADVGAMVRALDKRYFGGNGLSPNMSLSLRGYFQSLYYNSRLFAESGSAAGNADMAGVSGNYGFGIFWGSVSATGGASFNREIPDVSVYYPVTWNYGLRVSQSVKRATFSVNAGANVRGGQHSPYFSAFTNYSLGTSIGRHRFSASGDVNTRGVWVEPRDEAGYNRYSLSTGANAGWRWSNGGSGGNGAQSYAASVGMRDKWGIPTVGANANNSFNRGQLWLDYGMVNYESSLYDRLAHTARGTLSGSLMFADGLWALGRQTNGSFMLIDTRDNLKDATVHVNRSRLNRRDYSRNGWLGAGYQNYLMDYRPTEVTVSLTDVPPGALLESNVYHANGTYKQGYALRLGNKPEVIVQVRLLDNGQPLRYAYATVESERGAPDGERERRATFTNGEGTLQIGGLAPGGKYRFKFNPSTYIKDIIIEIPKDAEPMMELPDIVVERE